MIQESWPWKQELLRVSTRLERRSTQKRWTEQTSFNVERDVMLSAYAVRRLSEAFKITDETSAKRCRVRRFPLVGAPPDVYSRDEWYELFDLNAGRDDELPMLQVCNQIIHSWIFVLSTPEPTPGASSATGMDGIYVCSDRVRSSHLYFVSLDVLVDLFRTIGNEWVNSINMRRDEQGVMHYTELKRIPDSP